MTTIYYPTYQGSRIANGTRTFQANEDQGVTGWDKTADFILAIAIATSKGPLNYAYKLQWRNKTDSGSFADVSNTGEITYSAVTDLVDGDGLTSGEAGCTGVGTWQNGLESEGDNILPDTGTYSLADEYWTEFQWALDCSNALQGKEYEFRLLTTGGNLVGVCLATLTIATAGVEKGPVNAAVIIGNLVTASKTYGVVKSASVAIGNLVSASRKIFITRKASIVIDVVAKANRLVNYIRKPRWL